MADPATIARWISVVLCCASAVVLALALHSHRWVIPAGWDAAEDGFSLLSFRGCVYQPDGEPSSCQDESLLTIADAIDDAAPEVLRALNMKPMGTSARAGIAAWGAILAAIIALGVSAFSAAVNGARKATRGAATLAGIALVTASAAVATFYVKRTPVLQGAGAFAVGTQLWRFASGTATGLVGALLLRGVARRSSRSVGSATTPS